MCACARVTITSGALWMARIFFGEGFDEGLIFFFFFMEFQPISPSTDCSEPKKKRFGKAFIINGFE